MLSADQIIAELALLPHPEGGWYRQTWMGTEQPRAAGTAIYFLLKAGERSHWHRVDAVEIWHFHAGAPLRLSMAERETGPVQKAVLGADLQQCQRPQIIVPKDWWQSAQTLGDWTLVGCTVSPGFRFAGFDLAPPGFDIPSMQ